MSNTLDQSNSAWGLLANGSSGGWDLAVDESLDGDEWSLEIEGPQTYLVFQLQDLKVIERALHFLQSCPSKDQKRSGQQRSESENTLALGRFESATVALLWDNEDFPRCFIVIGPTGRSTLRISLEGEDIQGVVGALCQVVKDLPS